MPMVNVLFVDDEVPFVGSHVQAVGKERYQYRDFFQRT